MTVTVRLFATLKELLPEGRKKMEVDLEEDTTVRELAQEIDIADDEELIIKINGRRGSEDTILKDGDRVGLFPPVGGG
ncbi:MAG: MoaD/ThiS family protein [Halanaerobacter sp.]